MKSILLLMAIMTMLPLTSSADYFFVANDAVISKCIYTPLSGKHALESQLEASYGVNCDAMEDREGTVIVTCKKQLTNMIFATKTKNACNNLLASTKEILGN